jgi:sugar O-acyltransferase (sialic acid O-acetyltransferase NeuD family)
VKVFFVGGGILARMCHDMIKRQGHEVPVIYDRTKGMSPPPWDCTLIDDESAIPEYARTCDGFLVCIGDTHGQARVRYSRQLRDLGLQPISAIHPLAQLSELASIGEGVQAYARGYVGVESVIGDYCIINNNCTVGHQVTLGTGVHVMVAAVVTGVVEVGDFTSIGTNATVLPHLKIGSNCMIGAGAVVTKDLPDNAVAVGMPAKVIRYRSPGEDD